MACIVYSAKSFIWPLARWLEATFRCQVCDVCLPAGLHLWLVSHPIRSSAPPGDRLDAIGTSCLLQARMPRAMRCWRSTLARSVDPSSRSSRLSLEAEVSVCLRAVGPGIDWRDLVEPLSLAIAYSSSVSAGSSEAKERIHELGLGLSHGDLDRLFDARGHEHHHRQLRLSRHGTLPVGEGAGVMYHVLKLEILRGSQRSREVKRTF